MHEKLVQADDGSEMLLIPGGQFLFGISDSDLTNLAGTSSRAKQFRMAYDEPDLTTRDLQDYYIDKYPVTNQQFRDFLKKSGYRRKPRLIDSSIWGADLQPVVAVNWDDAQAYAKWCGKRLPSEQEWEKAARGTNGFLYPWGNLPDSTRCNCFESGLECTSEVGSYPHGASPYGVEDMSGNVWEMTSDKFDEESFSMKGGCYLTYIRFCRCTGRWAPSTEELEKGPTWLGFRCVRTP